jgi:hypothetical protein
LTTHPHDRQAMLSFTISISSLGGFSASVHHNTPIHTPSIHSVSASIPTSNNNYDYSSSIPPEHQKRQSYPYRYGIPIDINPGGTSLENLLPPCRRVEGSFVQQGKHNMMEKRNSVASQEGIPSERRKSFGRGGAGNIRMSLSFLLYLPPSFPYIDMFDT